MIEHDQSTVNTVKLELLPDYDVSISNTLQGDPGNGCFLDPPGYPSYFTRSIYNSSGNEPSAGPTKLLLGKVIESRRDWDNNKTWEMVCDTRSNRLRQLWMPLPINHPRTVAWIHALYKHQQHCYFDKDADESDHMLIYPIPSYKLKSFIDDERFSDEWRIKERAATDQANAETIAKALKVAIPDNHMAVRSVRKYYPEHVPDIELIKSPPSSTPTWWERFSECPTPENCPGGLGRNHPINESWCQVCGWHREE